MILTDKFYLFDVGVANYLARRRPIIGSAEFGHSFEHWILMELMNYRRYRAPDLEIRFWRTSTGQEVDFILGEMEAAVEVKGGARVHDGDLGGLRALRTSHRVKHAVIVCLETARRVVEPGIEILPWQAFLERLWGGELVG